MSEHGEDLVPFAYESTNAEGKKGMIVYWCPRRAVDWVTKKPGREFTEYNADETSVFVTWVFPDGQTWVSPSMRRKGDEPALLRAQVEQWAGRELTEREFGRVCKALPHSSVPDAIATIVDNL